MFVSAWGDSSCIWTKLETAPNEPPFAWPALFLKNGVQLVLIAIFGVTTFFSPRLAAIWKPWCCFNACMIRGDFEYGELAIGPFLKSAATRVEFKPESPPDP